MFARKHPWLIVLAFPHQLDNLVISLLLHDAAEMARKQLVDVKIDEEQTFPGAAGDVGVDKQMDLGSERCEALMIEN